VNYDAFGLLGRTLDPEVGEYRKLFALGPRGAHRESARRQAVELPARDAAKIARALKHEKLVEVVGPVERRAHTKPRVARVLFLGDGRHGGAVIEQVVLEQHAPRGLADDEVDVHGHVVNEPRVEQLERERAALADPDRRGRITDRPILIVGEPLVLFVFGLRRLNVLVPSELGRARDEHFPVEGLRGPLLSERTNRPASCEETDNR